MHTDSTAIITRYFNKDALKNYSAQKEFRYNDTYLGESLWTRFWRWFWALLDLKDHTIVTSVFFIVIEYLLIFLGLAALIYLILKLAGIDALNVFKRNALAATLPYNGFIEDIHEMDLDAEIEKAISKQNYRLAVRLLYLKCLKQLSDAGHIKWDVNKTNNTYINELNNTEQRLAFNLLTRQFEYVWYGELMIDAPVFTKIRALFNDFKITA